MDFNSNLQNIYSKVTKKVTPHTIGVNSRVGFTAPSVINTQLSSIQGNKATLENNAPSTSPQKYGNFNTPNTLQTLSGNNKNNFNGTDGSIKNTFDQNGNISQQAPTTNQSFGGSQAGQQVQGQGLYGKEDWANYQKGIAGISNDRNAAMQSAYAQDALRNRATLSSAASGGYSLGGAGMQNMIGSTQAGNMQNDQSVQNAYGSGGTMQQALFDDMEKRRQARARGEQQATMDTAGIISYGS
jgi:hypothetical protein